MSLLMTAGACYALLIKATDAVHSTYLLTTMSAFAWGNYAASRRRKQRLFAMLNWSGGLLDGRGSRVGIVLPEAGTEARR